MSCQVTALPLYGGIVFPSAIGAVVDGVPTTFHTPLSGHRSLVRAVVPNGLFTFAMFGYSFHHLSRSLPRPHNLA